MFRRLLVPLAATALLAGCVTTAPYGYRGNGQGDYYYGAPSTEYRYHGAYPGYGYPYYGPYRPGLSVWGSYGYGGYGYYGRPYYGNPYGGYYGNPYYGYPRNTHRPPRPDHRDGDHRPDGGAWRNLDEITRRRRGMDGGGGSSSIPTPSMPQPQVAPRIRNGNGDGSAMGQLIRRGRRTSQQDE
ncbi:hypothetical protein [Cognatilysobacter segetis]|uniref:hypothetical protein n=1 Tax=Cognatilysobacter segetis TaxID=2492394 RepID=UPI001EE46433|nr:hypothetical protein [Lysobacter segetis]